MGVAMFDPIGDGGLELGHAVEGVSLDALPSDLSIDMFPEDGCLRKKGGSAYAMEH